MTRGEMRRFGDVVLDAAEVMGSGDNQWIATTSALTNAMATSATGTGNANNPTPKVAPISS